MADIVEIKLLVDSVKGISGIKKFGDRLVNLSKDSKKSGKGLKNLGKEVKNLDDSARSTERRVGSLTGTIMKFVSAAAIMAGIKTSIGIASQFEDYKNTLSIVMKDTKKAGEMFRWAVEESNRTPFDTKDYIEGTVKLEAYGLSAKKTMGYIGDMAAVMNTDLLQAVEAVADAQTGEVERLKEYGITKEMIVSQASKMKLGEIVNSKGQITDLKRFNEALFALMQNKFDGGMLSKSKTFSGAISTIKGVIQSSMASIMGMSNSGEIAENSVFDVLRDGAGKLAETLVELQKSGKLAQWGKDMAESLKETAIFLRENKDGIKLLIQVLGILFTAFKALTIIGSITKVMRTMTAVQWSLNAAMTANPVGIVVAGLILLVGACYLIYKNFDKIKKKILELWKIFKESPLGKAFEYSPIGLFIKGIREIYNWYKRFKGVKDGKPEPNKIPKGKRGYGLAYEIPVDGSHRTGAPFIPKDGYHAVLHKGERVLTAKENKSYTPNQIIKDLRRKTR